MVQLKASNAGLVCQSTPVKRTRKQMQSPQSSSPAKRVLARKMISPIKKSALPLKTNCRRFSSPKWLPRAVPLRTPLKPIGKAWPNHQLRAYDLPDEVGWGDLCKDVLKSRGWTVREPCHSQDPDLITQDAQNVFVKEFEACIRGKSPEELWGKRGSTQQGFDGPYHLKTIPQPKFALWMMNFTTYRVPETNRGRAFPRDDFTQVVVKHGQALPGELGNHRIAGIPGLDTAVSKDRLSLALRDEPWYPMAYVLPQESKALLKRLRQPSANEYWIAKPRNECAGAGIAVWHGEDPELAKMVKENGAGTKRSVVQSYLANPLLIGGYKFHVRVHLVITNTSPLQAYVWRGGQCLFATKPYTLAKNTLGKQFEPPVHVTNQGLNATPENKENYCRVKPVIGAGQQLSMREMETYLANTYEHFDLQDFWRQVLHISTKTVKYISQASSVRRHGNLVPSRHFEVLGLDLMVDKDMKLYMCEINGSPGVNYPDKEVLGEPNPDYGKETIFCRQTFHDLLTLLGLDSGRQQTRGSLNNWYELDFSGHEGTSLAK